MTATAEVAPALDAPPDTAKPDRAPIGIRARHRLQTLGWPALAMVLIAAGAFVPLLFFSRFYFVGDTESGAYGQWYGIGTRLLSGQWGAVLNPTVYQAGVYLADGAWGFYSPLLWGIGLLTHVVDNILAFVFVLKLLTLCWAGLGTYVLARSFRMTRPWATLAAVAVPFGGFTSYQDITSWVTGAIAWSMFPWVWAGLRGFAHRGRSLLWVLLPAVTILGIVYTHATIMLIVVVLLVAVEAILDRRSRGKAMVRAAVAGVGVALMVVIVHLPALLVFPSTGRSQTITNDGTLVAPISSLLQAGVPFGTAAIASTSGMHTGHPLTYMLWVLPIITIIDWPRYWRLLRRHLSLPLFTLLIVLFVQAPSQLGPLRWPARLLPYATVGVVLFVLLGLSRARLPRPSPARLVAAGLLFGSAVWITWSSDPTTPVSMLLGDLGVALLLAALVWALSRYRGRRPRGRQRVALLAAAVVTVAILVPQHALTPTGGGPDQQLAVHLSTYRHMLSGSRGNVFVVGDARSGMGPAMSTQAAIGNSWYLTGKPVQNAYTTLQSDDYSHLLCMGVKGGTCTSAFRTLFSAEPISHETWVDLLGISSILLIKTSFHSTSWERIPPGWHVVSDTDQTRLLVRDSPVPGAGTVTWTTPGTSVDVDSESALAVRFTVTRSESGGAVVFSRLPWPGYTVSGGARLTDDPLGGVLLRIALPADAVGRSFTLTYAPPGIDTIRHAGVGLLVLLGLWLLLWIAALAVRRLRPWTGTRLWW